MLLVETYILVAEAGQGGYTYIRFYLPIDEVDRLSQNNLNPTSSSRGFGRLKKSVVAVKVAKETKNDKITQELEALQMIRNCPNKPPDAHFSKLKSDQIFQFSGLWEELNCLVLEAIMPAIELQDIFSAKPRIPIPLVYHLFLSLGSAVKFLRDKVKWAHRDIKGDNILVRRGPAKLPQFVLIDFGNAVEIEKLEGKNNDCKRCFDMVGKLANVVKRQRQQEQEQREWEEQEQEQQEPQEQETQHRQDWVDFGDMLETTDSQSDGQVDKDFENIWERWSGVARKAGKNTTDSEISSIEKILETAKPRGISGMVKDKDLIGAIERYREGKEAQRRGL